MKKTICASLAVLLSIASLASGASIVVGPQLPGFPQQPYLVGKNQPNISLPIWIDSDGGPATHVLVELSAYIESINGSNFVAPVFVDSAPAMVDPNSSDMDPTLQPWTVKGVDLVSGTILAGNHATSPNLTYPGNVALPTLGSGNPNNRKISVGVATNDGGYQPLQTGLLAILKISTMTVPEGSYYLRIGNGGVPGLPDTNLGPDEFFEPVFPEIFNGLIIVLPEPASVVMGLFGAAAIGAVVIRGRKRRQNG